MSIRGHDFHMHARREIQSLEIHCRIARLLTRDPQRVIGKALHNLNSWIQLHRNTALEAVYQEWLGILETRPPAEIAALLIAGDEGAIRLRQSSPFVGILSPQEIWSIKRSHATA
jgi:hypothetical protein